MHIFSKASIGGIGMKIEDGKQTLSRRCCSCRRVHYGYSDTYGYSD